MKKGYQNEVDFINYLNNRKYKEVNILFQDFLKSLYPNIKGEDLIQAYKYGKYAKADIVIEVCETKRGVSIKCGSKNSVHLEPIRDFVKYLEKLKFKQIDKLLYYLYSDGTNNNTGITRVTVNEYKENHKKEIIEINKELEVIKCELIKRFLIEADINYKVSVDAFISGNVNDFLWATKEEVIDYLKNINFESSGVHVSNLFIQNWNKNIKRNLKYEYCRDYIQVKWYSLFDDLMRIILHRKS